MRLNRLDLTRYGRFTEHSIDLVRQGGERADFHIIYGDNEAGKTTILNAYGDFLFGIAHSPDYDFQHKASMAVGAQIEIAGQHHDWVRLKKRDAKASLFDAHGRLADAGPLEAALSGMDRTTYKHMFLLNRKELEDGGEAILNSEGRLGELLFSATSGLSGITAGLGDLHRTIDGLFKPRGTKHRLKELMGELARLSDQQKSADLFVDAYAQMREELSDKEARYESARREEEALRQRLEAMQRRLDALPRWGRLGAYMKKLAGLDDRPPPPQGWKQRADDMAIEARTAQTKAADASREIERLQKQIAETSVNDALLGAAEQIDHLARQEESFQTARHDLPSVQAELDQTRRRIADGVKAIGRERDDDPSQLLLDAPLHADLREAIERIETIRAAHESAEAELDDARTGVQTTKAALDELGPPIDAQAQDILRERLDALRVARTRHETASQTLVEAERDLSAMFGKLSPWRGDLEALDALSVPSVAQLHDLAKRLSDARQQVQHLSEGLDKASHEFEQLRASAEALTSSGGLIGKDRLAAARRGRDNAWREHRSAIAEVISGAEPASLASTADRFEAQMSDDDQVNSAHAQQNEDRVRLRQISEEQARCQVDLDHLRKKLDAAQSDENETRASLGQIAQALGHEPGTNADTLREWLAQREQTLAMAERIKVLRAEQEARIERMRAATDNLGDVLAQIGIEAPSGEDPDALMRLAEMVRDQLSQTRGRREEAVKTDREAQAQLVRREREFDKAQRDLKQWQEGWDRLIGSCWLGNGDLPRTPNQVRAILSALDTLSEDLARLDELGTRVRRLSKVTETFEKLVDDASREAGVERRDEDAGTLARRLQAALKDARANLATCEARQAEIEKARAHLRDAQDRQKLLIVQQQEMFARYGVDDLDALRGALEAAAERASLVEQITGLEEELLASLGLSEPAQMAELLADAAEESLRKEIEEIRPRLELKTEDAREAYHSFKTARDAIGAVSADDRAALAMQQRRAVLSEIEQVAERYLRLSLGALAVSAALDTYRDHHRSSMMRSAASFFTTMTNGSFSDLRTQPGDKGEKLIGIPAAGGSLQASEMSEGTRHQLYLALRLAGYMEFVNGREPVPFLADDILASFDDTRAAAALGLLAQIARQGQVIYLTHHAHLCDIAARTCGADVSVHTLPALG